MRWVVAVVVCAVAGCIEPQLGACFDLACPADTVCDEVHRLCVTPDQLTACAGAPDLSPCVVQGVAAGCLDGVCLLPVCGDRFVEPGEACDDGNLVGGDGCDAICRSDERCGNGVVDPGETCDDANLMSADGCDSRCATEHEEWLLEGVNPLYGSEGGLVYDPIGQRVVQIAEGLAWTWDGTQWTLVSAGPYYFDSWWMRATYDPDRQSILYIVARYGGFIVEVWELEGTQWTQIPTTNPPRVASGITTYDPVRHRLLLISDHSGGVQLLSLDPETGTWAQLTPPFTGTLASTRPDIAFDEARGVAVLADAATTYEWNGVTWSTFASAVPNQASIAYDPAASAVITIGGSTTVKKWTGTTWGSVAGTVPTTTQYPGIAYDAHRQRLVVFGAPEVDEFDGSLWRGPLYGSQPAVMKGSIAYDPKRHELVMFGGQINNNTPNLDVWVWRNGVWRKLSTGLPGLVGPTHMAYDPVRDGIIASDSDAGTWLFRDDAWTSIEPAATGAGVRPHSAITFDPRRRGLVAIDGSATYLLPSNGIAWQQLPDPPPSSSYGSLAFDARMNRLMLCDGFEGVWWEIDDAWVNTLSPGEFYSLVENSRQGTVELVGATGSVWEHRGPAWIEKPPVPYAVYGQVVYAADTGEVIVVGSLNTALVLLRRRTTSGAPMESCAPAADDDGDGLLGCDDPDCFWNCSPACPPFATCP